MPIWGALLAFTGLFVIYFIVLKCTSTKDKSNAEIEKIEENKAFDSDEKPEIQNDTDKGRVSASEFKIISKVGGVFPDGHLLRILLWALKRR